jgi:hypothetical protein
MSTVANSTEKRTPQDFAKNYPLAPKDGRYPNIAVGNITEFNGRYIINLCLKTVRSNENGLGASMSHPVEWGMKYQTGQHVDVLIEKGYVKKLLTSQLSKTVSVIEASNATILASSPATAVAVLEEKAAKQAEALPVVAGDEQPF